MLLCCLFKVVKAEQIVKLYRNLQDSLDSDLNVNESSKRRETKDSSNVDQTQDAINQVDETDSE